MLVAIFWAALFLVVYTYLIYPVLLWLLAAGRKMPEYAPLSEWPETSLIIAAHNEEAVLRAKLENALAMDYPAERLDIIVVSDASTDDTDRIAAEFAARGVRLHRQEVRGGKTEAQNAGVRLARGQFVAFSDANSMYAPSALKRLLAPFADERIGCVCGELQYANPDEQGAGKGEGLYWRYEQFLKRRESLLSSALGANGAIYALRRELFVELRGDIISDFVAPLHAWRRGFRIAYEPTAVATEYSSGRFGDEFRRRRRIVSRSLYGLWTEAGVLNPFAHFFFCVSDVFPQVAPLARAGVAVGSARGQYPIGRGRVLRPLARAASGFLRLGRIGPLAAGAARALLAVLRAGLFHRYQLGHLAGAAELPNGSPPPRLAAREVERLCRA